MIRDMFTPFLLASRLTDPVTDVSNEIEDKFFVLKLTGSRKFEIPTC